MSPLHLMNFIRREEKPDVKFNPGYTLSQMHPVGLWEARSVDLFECVCKRILGSQQPDVCHAIPLHNYLRTSGTCKHSERAGELQPRVFFFVPYCLFIIVRYLMTISPDVLPLNKPFLFIFPHIQPFTLSFSTHILYSSLPCSTAPMPDQCIYTLTVVPTLHQHIHIQSLLFSPSIWWPPCFLPPSYILCLVSFVCAAFTCHSF